MVSVSPSVVGSSTGAPSGSIRWEVDKDSISKDNIYSHTIEVGGIQWALSVCKMQEGEELSFFLYQIEGDYEVQTVDAAFEITMINHDDDTKTILRKSYNQFLNIDHWGFPKYIKWSEAIDEGKGFIKNGKFIVQCDFSMLTIRGFRKLRRIDFTNPNEPSSDIILVVNGVKFYVSKQHLAILSPVFHTMFYGEFAEKEKKEIELKDVDNKEFNSMLGVIYPPHKKITNGNVRFLLKLGDRFEIDMVTKEVEQFLLVSTTTMDISAKMLLAEQYRLHKLMDHCVRQLNTVKDVTDLKNSADYRNFSDTTKAILLEKMITLTLTV